MSILITANKVYFSFVRKITTLLDEAIYKTHITIPNPDAVLISCSGKPLSLTWSIDLYSLKLFSTRSMSTSLLDIRRKAHTLLTNWCPSSGQDSVKFCSSQEVAWLEHGGYSIPSTFIFQGWRNGCLLSWGGVGWALASESVLLSWAFLSYCCFQ